MLNNCKSLQRFDFCFPFLLLPELNKHTENKGGAGGCGKMGEWVEGGGGVGGGGSGRELKKCRRQSGRVTSRRGAV